MNPAVFAKDPDTLVFSFQKQKNPEELKKAAQKISEYLSKQTGKKIETLIPTSYSASVQGLISKKIHVAYMDSLPFILAENEIPLEIIAVEKRNKKTTYDSIFVVKKDSPLKNLKDLKGKTIAFSSQTSTSGYLYPFFRLLKDQIISEPKQLSSFFSKIHYAGGYDKALTAVAMGQADVAALSDYAFEGAKSSLYLDEKTKSGLRILARTPGVPTHLIAVSSELSSELKNKIQSALLQLSQENSELLSSVYGAAELSPSSAEHVQNTRNALKQTQLAVESFVK